MPSIRRYAGCSTTCPRPPRWLRASGCSCRSVVSVSVGLVIEEASTSDVPADRLKPVLEVLDSEAVLDASAIELLKWAAEYYHHPIGEVIATAMPKALREGAATVAVEQVWSLTPAGSEALAAGEPRRAPKQRRVLELLAQQEETSAASLASMMEGWADGARALAKRGWAISRERAVAPDDGRPTTPHADASPKTPRCWRQSKARLSSESPSHSGSSAPSFSTASRAAARPRCICR